MQTIFYISILVPIYTKRQRCHCGDARDIALVEINGKIELFQNGVATHYGVTPLISMGAMAQALL